MDKLATAWTPRMLSILRIVTAFLFMQHGAQKIFGFPCHNDMTLISFQCPVLQDH